MQPNAHDIHRANIAYHLYTTLADLSSGKCKLGEAVARITPLLTVDLTVTEVLKAGAQ